MKYNRTERLAKTGHAPAGAAAQPLLLLAGAVTVTTAVPLAVPSIVLVAMTWYVPAVVVEKTPPSVTVPLGVTDQFTPSYVPMPVTAAVKGAVPPVCIDAVDGVTVTPVYRWMTWNPLS